MTKQSMRPLIFGEVLFDCFPDGSAVLGGAPFNVAWHLQAFGLQPLMITRIGCDVMGDDIASSMQHWGMDCSGLQRDAKHATGRVDVSFNNGEPAYDIVDSAAYDFIDASELPELAGAWLLYHGSLALRHNESARAVAHLNKANIHTRLVDINLRAPWWQRRRLFELMHGASWVKLNADELVTIFPAESSKEKRLRLLMDHVSDGVLLTGGEAGASLHPKGDGPDCAVSPATKVDVVDTVGAGDAFCSVFLAGLLLEWPAGLCMQRAQQFASAIVGIRGATPQDASFYDPFMKSWGIRSQSDV